MYQSRISLAPEKTFPGETIILIKLYLALPLAVTETQLVGKLFNVSSYTHKI